MKTPSVPPRSGVTLVELLIVLVILGLVAGVVLPAWSRNHTSPAEDGELQQTVAALRRAAISSGRPQRVDLRLRPDQTVLPPGELSSDAAAYSITALPDGSVLSDSILRINRVLGTPLDTLRAP